MSDLKNAGKSRGKGLAKITVRKNCIYKFECMGTLVRLLWRAAATGLKPLRLPRARTWFAMGGLDPADFHPRVPFAEPVSSGSSGVHSRHSRL